MIKFLFQCLIIYIKQGAVQSYEEISGAVYDSFPVQLNLAQEVTTKRVEQATKRTAARTPKAGVKSEDVPKRAIIKPLSSEHSYLNATLTQEEIAAATDRRDNTASHNSESYESIAIAI